MQLLLLLLGLFLFQYGLIIYNIHKRCNSNNIQVSIPIWSDYLFNCNSGITYLYKFLFQYGLIIYTKIWRAKYLKYRFLFQYGLIIYASKPTSYIFIFLRFYSNMVWLSIKNLDSVEIPCTCVSIPIWSDYLL